MLTSIEELLQFHRQKYHIDIRLVRELSQIEDWDAPGITVGIPNGEGVIVEIGEAIFQQNGSFQEKTGDLIVVEDQRVAVQGENFLLFNLCPINEPAVRLVRNLIDQLIPKMARLLRKQSRSEYLNGMLGTARARKSDLNDQIKEETYQLDDLTEQVNRASRRLALCKKMLTFFDHPEEHFKRQVLRMFSDLMKLVPGNYSSFRFEDGKIIGTTQPIVIVHDDQSYEFEPYEVRFDLRSQQVAITGDANSVNGYIHPHVTTSSSICWGNIGGLVARLSGEMDLYGLYELIATFLSLYNEDDPYQRIERWDPNWEESNEENEPYCSFCDESGHEISECEWCWWCEHCEEYVDHYEEDCPCRKPEESEPNQEEVEVAELDSVTP